MKPRLLVASVALACVANAGAAPAEEAGARACARLPDDAQRLACYDRLFAPAAVGETPGASAAPPAAGLSPPAGPGRASPLSVAWELAPADKRGTFVVRTYLPNYFLPLHLTSSLVAPSSPTHAAPDNYGRYRRTEAKLQVSLRAKVIEDLWPAGADLWFAYTQRSLWQLWNEQESSPFRSTDYQPEAIYVVPTSSHAWSDLGAGWRLRMLQFGLAHQSNGQGDPLSRSWNRVYVGAGIDRDSLALQLTAHRRLPESGIDDNPGLTDFIGAQEVVAAWVTPRTTAALTWKTNLGDPRRGSIQLDWTYPVRGAQPGGLRWYLQFFSGYGETLLDYNRHQSSVGAGLSLFQF